MIETGPGRFFFRVFLYGVTMNLSIGDLAPDFTLLNHQGEEVKLSQFRGKSVILYFYPKDDTPGCTKEACSFSESLSDISNLNAVVLGVSKDSVMSHNKFIDKYSLSFPLLSDPDGVVCEAYGVWGEKSMYGRTYFGIHRVTYLIDEKGIIKKIWPKVKVTGHTKEVMEALS